MVTKTEKNKEKWIEDKVHELWNNQSFKEIKGIIRQIVAEVRKAKITDDLLDDIIDVVLEHADCHHDYYRDEDGKHATSEYSLDSEMIVKEKLKKLLFP